MIIYNKEYSINNGTGSIIFEDKGNQNVSAVYTISGNKDKGDVIGMIDQNQFKGKFIVAKSEGLMDILFTETGFEAKWKKGIEPGPMKGKWMGEILEDEKNIEKSKSIITSTSISTNEKVNSSVETGTLKTLIDQEKDFNDRLIKLNAEILEKEVKLNLLVNQIAQKEQQLLKSSNETGVTPPKKKIQEYTNVNVQIKITTSQKFTDTYSCKSYNLPQPGDTKFYNLIFKVHYQYNLTKAKLRAVLEQAATDVSYSDSEGYALELMDINDDSSYSTKIKNTYPSCIYVLSKSIIKFFDILL